MIGLALIAIGYATVIAATGWPGVLGVVVHVVVMAVATNRRR